MSIAEYKEATVKLREFILWSRKNYTMTPKKVAARIEVFAADTVFSFQRLHDAALRLGQAFSETSTLLKHFEK